MLGTTAGFCEALAFLPSALRSEVLRTYPTIDQTLVSDDLVCALGRHVEGAHHAVVYDHFPGSRTGAVWTHWRNDAPPDTFSLRSDCTERSLSGGAACGHFLGHPGPHSWETDAPN